MEIPRSAKLLADMILHNPSILEAVKTNPEETLNKLVEDVTKNLPPPPLVRDSGIYYIVVIALGLVAVMGIGGVIYLTASATGSTTPQVPDTITALASASIGALAGLLAPSPGRS